jgi:hypothetical protein
MRIIHFAFLLIAIATPASAGCPPIDPSTLWLPKDKEFAKKEFQAKAKKLNDSGKCVVEGGFGRSYKKFYITVTETGSLRDAKILRFSFAELKK